MALVGGYLLGRTKKAKMALGLGMLLAGRKLPSNPADLGKLLASSPILGGLTDQMRRELVDATKSAATSALTNRATGLADKLHSRTLSLQGGGDGEHADDEPRDEDEGPEEEHEEDVEQERAPRRATSSTRTRKAAASRPRKAEGTRRTTGQARKTATGTAGKAARKTTRAPRSRGGGDE